MAANLRGYKVILVIPDNYSEEKQRILKLYGAEVVLSDSRKGNNSHGEKALEMLLENPQYVMLNQQRNPANPQAHRTSTAKEIIEDCSAMGLDIFVGGIGTGGHITGIGELLKARWPNIQVVGVEPQGCDLLNNIHSPHQIQGLSVGIVPEVLNIKIIDRMCSVTLRECIDLAKRIIKTESLSIGLSSAANLAAVKKMRGKTVRPGDNVLTLAYDSIDSYMDHCSQSARSHGSVTEVMSHCM